MRHKSLRRATSPLAQAGPGAVQGMVLPHRQCASGPLSVQPWPGGTPANGFFSGFSDGGFCNVSRQRGSLYGSAHPAASWGLGNREAPSLPLSPHSRQSPAVGQRKFGEGRREGKAPGRFRLSEPRTVPLGACDPFSSFQIHLFIFFRLLAVAQRDPGCESIPAGRPLAFASSWPRSHREGLWLLGHESRSLSEGTDVSPWPGACAGSGLWRGGGSAHRHWEDWGSVRG